MAVNWGRTLAIGAVMAIGVGTTSWWWASSTDTPSRAQGSAGYVIRMSDYTFGPQDMTWQVGSRVTLVFVNETQAHPGRAHEFMMGREPTTEETLFGSRFPGGFDEDFFAGLAVGISHSDAVSMVMPGESELGGPDAGGPFVMEEDMDMDGEPEMDMNEPGADEHDEDVGDMDNPNSNRFRGAMVTKMLGRRTDDDRSRNVRPATATNSDLRAGPGHGRRVDDLCAAFRDPILGRGHRHSHER